MCKKIWDTKGVLSYVLIVEGKGISCITFQALVVWENSVFMWFLGVPSLTCFARPCLAQCSSVFKSFGGVFALFDSCFAVADVAVLPCFRGARILYVAPRFVPVADVPAVVPDRDTTRARRGLLHEDDLSSVSQRVLNSVRGCSFLDWILATRKHFCADGKSFHRLRENALDFLFSECQGVTFLRYGSRLQNRSKPRTLSSIVGLIFDVVTVWNSHGSRLLVRHTMSSVSFFSHNNDKSTIFPTMESETVSTTIEMRYTTAGRTTKHHSEFAK